MLGHTRSGPRGNLIPTSLSPVEISDSGSEPDVEIASSDISDIPYIPTLPYAEIGRQNKSASFDGGCIPLPLLFERRNRLLSMPAPIEPIRLAPDDELDTAKLPSTANSKLSEPLPLSSGVPSTPETIQKPPESRSSFGFTSEFDYSKFASFSRCVLDSSKVGRLTPKVKTVGFPGGADYKDCFGSLREPLVLHSHIAARNEQYRSIGPVVRSNEVVLVMSSLNILQNVMLYS